MHFLVVGLCALAALGAVSAGEDVEHGLLEEFGVTMTHAEALAANVTFGSFLSDSAVAEQLGCHSQDFCNGNTILDVAWKLKARLFVKASLYAGLGSVLKRQNPLTAFVPSDKAFASLPLPLHVYFFTHPRVLRDVLEYHIVNGKFDSTKLHDEEVLNTRLDNLTIRYNRYVHPNTPDSEIETIQGSRITLFDQWASNGWIHVIDAVILKVATGNLYERLRQSTGFSSFYDALVIAGIDQNLKNLPFGTVFAPSNQAIANLPDGYWANLLNNKAALKDVLNYHISPNGVYFSRGVKDGDSIATWNKRNVLTVHIHENRGLQIDNARVLFRDVGASNGIVDGIDHLLIPSK